MWNWIRTFLLTSFALTTLSFGTRLAAFSSAREHTPRTYCTPLHNHTTVECHNALNSSSELREFKAMFSEFPIMDFSQNYLMSLHLKDFQWFQQLRFLNLSRNAIVFMDNGTFDDQKQLVTLDLSYNQLKVLHPGNFRGLDRLERLLLGGNPISQLRERIFENLPALNYLDLSDMPLICDCDMAWISNRIRQGRLSVSSSTVCSAPAPVRGLKLSDLSLEQLICAPSEVQLTITPTNPQTVVSGDRFHLECLATLIPRDMPPRITWRHNGVEPIPSHVDLFHDVENRLVTSTLELRNVTERDDGTWTCHVTVGGYNRSVSTTLFVMQAGSSKCPSEVTNSSRGSYYWPSTAARDLTVELPCQERDDKATHAIATRLCDRFGKWHAPSFHGCSYLPEFERSLALHISSTAEQASQVADLLSKYLLGHAAAEVVLTAERLDLVLTAMERVMQAINTTDTPLQISSNVSQIANWVMDAPYSVWSGGQADRDTQRMMKLIIASANSSGDFTFKNFARTFVPLAGELSTDIFCRVGASSLMEVNCSGGTTQQGPLLATVSIPAKHARQQLLVVAFRNVKAFAALLGRSATPSSVIVGVFPRGSSLDPKPQEGFAVELMTPLLTDQSVPLYLSESFFKSGDGCLGVERDVDAGLVKLACSRFGLVTVTQPFDLIEGYHTRALSIRIPIFLYACGVLAILTHILLILISASRFVKSPLPQLYKHCLMNFWMSLDALLVVFLCGFTETAHHISCIIMGVFLHYFTLCCLLWMFLSFYNIYKHTRQSLIDPMTHYKPDPESGPRKSRPNVGGLYLCGWGVPVILTGIPAAIYSPLYASQRYCYLRTPHNFIAILLTCAILVAACCLLGLLVVCRRRSKRIPSDLEAGGGSVPHFDTAFSGQSHVILLTFYMALFLLAYAVIGFWAGGPHAGANWHATAESQTAFDVASGICLLLLSVFAVGAFWLARKDMRGACCSKSRPPGTASPAAPFVERYTPLLESEMIYGREVSSRPATVTERERTSGRVSAADSAGDGGLVPRRLLSPYHSMVYVPPPAVVDGAGTENGYSFKTGSGHVVSYASGVGSTLLGSLACSGSGQPMFSSRRPYLNGIGESESANFETSI
ncbi:putative Adhesion [Hypsibius exemplaris]|uniref:Adhesion n=1 Tax=Hypsibius exemplaris TaxID=2072580 RepID=A0A1W0WWN0_HYPEX|nr:putative Adhesion [Hypsibius exemplaris]